MSRSKEMDLTVGDPFRSLLKFAIPVILGNLFQLCYTLADSVIVGKTLGENSLAAVGATMALPEASASALDSVSAPAMRLECGRVSPFPLCSALVSP